MVDPVLRENARSDLHWYSTREGLPGDQRDRTKALLECYLSFITVVKAEVCYVYTPDLLPVMRAVLAAVHEHLLQQGGKPDNDWLERHFEEELAERSFWLLLSIVDRPGCELYRADFSRGWALQGKLQGSRRKTAEVKLALGQIAPELNFKLNKIGLGCEQFVAGGLNSLMADRLPFYLLFRFWDVLFLESLYSEEELALTTLLAGNLQFVLEMAPFLLELATRPEFEEAVAVQRQLLN